MIPRIRTRPFLACLAVLALSMPSDAEAGFGFFKRFKKKTALLFTTTFGSLTRDYSSLPAVRPRFDFP
jgi:hypothetical protein